MTSYQNKNIHDSHHSYTKPAKIYKKLKNITTFCRRRHFLRDLQNSNLNILSRRTILRTAFAIWRNVPVFRIVTPFCYTTRSPLPTLFRFADWSIYNIFLSWQNTKQTMLLMFLMKQTFIFVVVYIRIWVIFIIY